MTRIVATLLGFLALAPIAAWAQAQCSAQTLKGQCIFVGRGYIEPDDPGVPRVHSGVLVFDAAGNVSGKQSSSRGGKIGRENPQGTYKLDADCSGTMTIGPVANPGAQIHWDVYVTQDGRMGHMIRTDPGSMAVRSFEK